MFRIESYTYLSPMQIWRQLWELVVNIVSDVVHEPLEVLALESLLQSHLFRDVAHVQEPSERLPSVEELLVLLIEPCLYHPFVVL